MKEQKIVDLLPSADLRAKIRASNHRFRENELLQIAYRYAPTFEARMEWLENFAETATPPVAALARAYMERDRASLAWFTEASPHVVYELCIRVTPSAYKEKYLCATYKDALVCIDRFYEAYESAEEGEATRYEITRRKIFSETDPFDEDAEGLCILGPDKTVLEVSDYGSFVDCEREASCSACEEVCARRCDEVRYPRFIEHHELVRYSDFSENDAFGVCLCLEDEDGDTVSELYVIALDTAVMRERHYEAEGNPYAFHEAHRHVEPPHVTRASADELDERMREVYDAFMDFLNAREL